MRRIAVIAGTAELPTPDEQAAAFHLGRLLGEHSLTLVFDGSAEGVIATVADSCLQHGGRLIGITVPGAASRPDLTERREADSPDAARAQTVELVDAWIGLPQGVGSLDEAFAVWDWPGLRRSEQPLGLLDSGGYYSGLLKTASDDGVDRFVRESQRGRLVVSTSAEDLLRRLADYRPPETRRDAPYED
ncbi:MAG: LOG family protein [Gemmatimonadales bacterium]